MFVGFAFVICILCVILISILCNFGMRPLDKPYPCFWGKCRFLIKYVYVKVEIGKVETRVDRYDCTGCIKKKVIEL